MHEYRTGGNCRWVVWDSNDSSYEYVVKVACDPASDSRARMFRIDSSLPNAGAPSGYSELAVVNGSIFAPDSGSYVVGGLAYNLGGNVNIMEFSLTGEVHLEIIITYLCTHMVVDKWSLLLHIIWMQVVQQSH